jgi:catalase-peroxidase
VPFSPGRTDATQEQTDVVSFEVLEPVADGFRNYLKANRRIARGTAARQGATPDPDRPGDDGARRRPAGLERQRRPDRPRRIHRAARRALSNDFFVNLLDMGTVWAPTSEAGICSKGRDRATGKLKWTATRVDLVFGSNSQLRALAEVYAQDDMKENLRARLRRRVEQGDEPGSLRQHTGGLLIQTVAEFLARW